MRTLLLVLTCVATASLSPSAWAKGGKKEGDGEVEVVEIPAALAPAVADASTRGRTIWELDQATAINSKTVAGWIALDARVTGGAVTVRDGMTFNTIWWGDIDGVRVGLYSVTFDMTAGMMRSNVPDKPDAAALPKPFALSEADLARAHAVEAAQKAPFEHLADRYNTVVMASGEGLSVYLIAATTDPDLILVGGIVRVEVSAAGEVTAVMPLSKTVQRLPRPGTGGVPADTTSYMPMVTELGLHPTESHVFASKTYGVPLLVLCGTTSWLVQGETIRIVKLPE